MGIVISDVLVGPPEIISQLLWCKHLKLNTDNDTFLFALYGSCYFSCFCMSFCIYLSYFDVRNWYWSMTMTLFLPYMVIVISAVLHVLLHLSKLLWCKGFVLINDNDTFVFLPCLIVSAVVVVYLIVVSIFIVILMPTNLINIAAFIYLHTHSVCCTLYMYM